MKNLLKEFKEFAMRGNVIDLAIGVVIGGAFGKIVTSLVTDILTPLLGLITGSADFSEMKYVIVTSAERENIEILYGLFIQSLIDFLIISFSIFMVIRIANKFAKRNKEEAVEEAAAPTPSEEVVLLTKILEEIKK